MNKVTISFTVDTNQALLLQTLYDWITKPKGTDPFISMQNSTAFIDYLPWLVDEIDAGVATWSKLVENGVVPDTTSLAVKILQKSHIDL